MLPTAAIAISYVLSPSAQPLKPLPVNNYIICRPFSSTDSRPSLYNNTIFFTEDNNLCSPELSRNLQKIEKFREYKENWNGYGASAFSEELLDIAEEILKRLNYQPEVFPVAGGAIQFEYEKKNGEYLEFEISIDKWIMGFQIDSAGKEQQLKTERDSNKINEVVDTFYG